MKQIEIATWDRRSFFEFYKQFDTPRYSVSAKVDATKAIAFCRTQKIPFFDFCLYAFLRANNETPAFRLRLVDDTVVDLEEVGASTAILTLGEELFHSIQVPYNKDLSEFCAVLEKKKKEPAPILKAGIPVHQKSKEKPLVSLTCLPWFSFDALALPCLDNHQGMPVMAWGKEIKTGTKIQLPFTLQVNHMFIDGIHIGHFIRRLNSFFAHPDKI